MKRRNFLKTSMLSVGALGLGYQHAFADKPIPVSGDPAEKHLTAYIYDSEKSSVWIRWNNNILTCYRAEALQKYPYFYPLRALKSGLSLTTETAQPWPHHRSVFFGLDRVNGANYWQNNPDKDRIVSTKLALGECKEMSAEILNECLWTPFEKEPIIADKRRFVVTIINDETYTLDCYFELLALTDVVCEKTNHGLFGVRTENDLSVDGGGVLINSEGQQTQANTLDKPARWMAGYGKRYGRDDGLIEGLAIMSPPYKRSPFDRNIWFTRDYGNFSPTPFNSFAAGEKFIMPKDDVLRLAYRIVAFTGVPSNSFLNSQWNEFAAISEGKRS
jgi:Zn finger protein HypA/HybF involved in hydrogenase expression